MVAEPAGWFRVVAVLLVLGSHLSALEQRLAGSQVLTGTHYVVESDAEPADGKAMLDHLERFHDHLAQVFEGITVAASTPEVVRYCRERATFLAYGRAHCPGFSDGWYGYQEDGDAKTPGEIVLMHLGTNRSVLQHEAFHRFMFRSFPALRAWPRWFDEGVADWIARGRFHDGRFTMPERLDAADLARVRDALSNGSFVSLERLMVLDNAAWNGQQQALHYAEGYLLTAWLMSVEEAPYRGLLRDFFLRLARTQRYQEAFDATIAAVGVTRLQSAWVEWLRRLR